jgi:aerobic-type carbon monoxide dehydrogenase small subunit (CoxS/CutS family)
MSLHALFDANDNPTDEQIERAVTGNLCRCGAYLNIARAGRLAVELRANGLPEGKAGSGGEQ